MRRITSIVCIILGMIYLGVYGAYVTHLALEDMPEKTDPVTVMITAPFVRISEAPSLLLVGVFFFGIGWVLMPGVQQEADETPKAQKEKENEPCFCPDCGKPVSVGSSLCPYCAASITVSKAVPPIPGSPTVYNTINGIPATVTAGVLFVAAVLCAAFVKQQPLLGGALLVTSSVFVIMGIVQGILIIKQQNKQRGIVILLCNLLLVGLGCVLLV